MSDKFALKWNDFQANWNNSLSELRKETDFADVTLISEDKVKFSAHKLILTSCSNMFKFILKENTHANPLLYIGGVSSKNMGFILDYIYHGEVNIYQEHLDSFLESAQKLEIAGLIGGNQDRNELENPLIRQNETDETHLPQADKIFKEEQVLVSGANSSSLVTTADSSVEKQRRQYNRGILDDNNKIYVGDLTPEEIEAQTKELYQKVDGEYACLHCGKTSTKISNMKFHVETHLEGLCYTCNICGKEFRSKNILRHHKQQSHM